MANPSKESRYNQHFIQEPQKFWEFLHTHPVLHHLNLKTQQLLAASRLISQLIRPHYSYNSNNHRNLI